MEQDHIIKKTVLILEDEPAIARACKKVLKSEGFEVETAANGLIAMNMVKEKNFDCVLSDIKTPLMNGMEFYRYLQITRPELASNTLFITGDNLSDNVEAFLKEIQRPFLLKPFILDDLIRAIKDICQKDKPGLLESSSGKQQGQYNGI